MGPPAEPLAVTEPGPGGVLLARAGSRPPTPSPHRVFLALVDEVEDRGTVVAQGGGKVSWLTVSFPRV